jgi:hypothetical protein
MKKSIDNIISLYEDNNDNKEICDKITSFICNRLPIEVICWTKELDKNNINVEKNTFISQFLNDNGEQFYYIKESDTFIKYNNVNYSLIGEDELLYLILSEISKNKILLSKKQQIKNIIIKEIKTNIFGYGIPESITIQNIINYLYPVLFKTKSEAKYFLCILGDNILKKKQTTSNLVRNDYFIFLHHINNCFNDYYKFNIIDNFSHKVIETKTSRTLDFKHSIHNKVFWQHFIEQNILNILSVSMHYSQRYDNSEYYLENNIEYKGKILFFAINSKQDIIEKFVKKKITKNDNEKISKKEIYYLWNLFLIEENIPSIFKDENEFYSTLTLNVKHNIYTNIFSENLLIVREFTCFWNESMKEDKNDIIEISEILHFFKQKKKIKTSESEIISIIEYFYPCIKITNGKYINYKCVLWDKKETIKSVIGKIKGNITINTANANINLYKKYCMYLKKKDELVVNKTYFMDVLHEYSM